MKLDIGKFKVKSGKVVVGDPYHSHLVESNTNIFDVKKGRWNCRIRKASDDSIAELIILHKDMNFDIDDTEYYWEPTDKFTEIDSEIVGIFDIDSFYNEEIISKEMTKNILSVEDNVWLNYCLSMTLCGDKASSIPNGVVTLVNNKKDYYNIFMITNHESEIIGLKVELMEEWEEYIPIEESENY